MNKRLDEQGVSLVELIAALALVSMVAVLIMTTLSIGIKHSSIEGDKVRIQQEANIIVSKLLNKHRVGDTYCLGIKEESLVTYSLNAQKECDLNHPSHSINSDEYEVSEFTSNINSNQVIDPTKQDVKISMKLSYVSTTNKNSTYIINTTLSRYKTE